MPPVSENELVDAYHLLLGREPEPTVRINASDSKWSSWKEMRADFLASPEGRMAVADVLFDGFRVRQNGGLAAERLGQDRNRRLEGQYTFV